MSGPILAISDLSAVSDRDHTPILRAASLSVERGETRGLVGESGAGKSTIGKAILGILPRVVRITSGEVLFEGENLLTMAPAQRRRLIGERVALIPQDPMTALNPGRRIEGQLTDGLRLWRNLDASAARKTAMKLLDEVHIRDPERVLRSFPHELSGGMRQRVLIAAAFALEPKLIVADEPTTALDVTVQKQILRLIQAMQSAHGTSVLFVSHDLGVVARICDRVTLLFDGRVIEEGRTADVMQAAAPSLYARAPRRLPALRSTGRWLETNSQGGHRTIARGDRGMSGDLLVARDVEVVYGAQPRWLGRAREPVKVLNGVTVRIGRGETVGIVGESGSGKTTLGRAMLRLVDVVSGSIAFDGQDITRLSVAEMRPLRRRMQLIFQDPMASLNPRRTIGRIVTEPMLLHKIAKDEADAAVQTREIFARFGLPLTCLDRYPHELSGGQRQRVGIARTALLAPDFVLADEIVSGLDVSTQAQVLNLLKGLSRELGLAMAFISHDLSVIRAICNRVYVLRSGRVVEEGYCEDIFAAPKHDYTKALLDAIPLPGIDLCWIQ